MCFGDGPWGKNNGGGFSPNNGRRNLSELFGFDKNKVPNFKVNNSGSIIAIIFFVVISVWLATGIYVISPDEEGVELRFGKYILTTVPGLHYHFPYPVEDVIKVKVTNVNRVEIGYRSDFVGSRSGKTEEDVESESMVLTKDENILDINFEVQWRINNSRDFLFNFKDSNFGRTVRDAAESSMREIVGNSSLVFILEGEGRAVLAGKIEVMLQSILDDYDVGIDILSVQIRKIDPPGKVIDAFRDVQSARADKEREINEAYAYRNDVLPRARGEAAKIVNAAEAYSEEVISDAQGEASKFISIYSKYKIMPEINKKRIYISTLEDVFKHMEKIIVDKEAVIYHMPLDRFVNSKE